MIVSKNGRVQICWINKWFGDLFYLLSSVEFRSVCALINWFSRMPKNQNNFVSRWLDPKIKLFFLKFSAMMNVKMFALFANSS